MSDQTPEDTDQTDAAAAVEVPNITDNAVSGLDHEPLTPRKTTLVGRDSVTLSHDDGTTTTTETITDEVDTSPDDVDGGTVEEGGGGAAVNGDTGEVTQPGEPLPDAEGDDSGTPIGDAVQQQTDSGDGQSGDAALEDEPTASPDSQ